jgi:hypothetical protein
VVFSRLGAVRRMGGWAVFAMGSAQEDPEGTELSQWGRDLL